MNKTNMNEMLNSLEKELNEVNNSQDIKKVVLETLDVIGDLAYSDTGSDMIYDVNTEKIDIKEAVKNRKQLAKQLLQDNKVFEEVVNLMFAAINYKMDDEE